MILHELHIAQRYAVAERHTHTIAGDDPAVGIVAIYASCAAGRQNYRVGADLYQRTLHHIHRDQTARLTFVDQDIEDKVFVEALDLGELKRGLEQGVQHMKAGFIGCEPGSLDLHTAEAPDVDAAVRAAAPRTTPLLKLGHFRRAVMNEVVDDILFA